LPPSARTRVNGVSALHTALILTSGFTHLHRLYPDRAVNKTNVILVSPLVHQGHSCIDQAVL